MAATPTAKSGSYGGLIPVANVAALDAEDARANAEKKNSEPVIQGLAAHVKKCFDAAVEAKRDATERMLNNLRARRGEYDSETLAAIREAGGSEIYMMLTANKCHAATAWLQDTLLANGLEKPWTISSTKEPDLPPDALQDAVAKAGELVEQLQQMLGGPEMVSEAQVEELLQLSKSRSMVEIKLAADKRVSRMESRMEDQLQEGGFLEAFSEFLDDISTFPSAILKGPVIRNKPQLTWEQTADGSFKPVTQDKLLPEWERVSPFNIYPAPGAVRVNDGYLVEHHTMYPSDLEQLIGVDGYDEAAIRAVIGEHGESGLKDWLGLNISDRADAEDQTASVSDTTSPTIDALQFWGPVLGKTLIDWGMGAEKVPVPTKTYHCEVWLIGTWVVKATLNYDPLGRRPYYKTSYKILPGSFWGNAPPDLIADSQAMCNNAARALANNMAIASGPQAVVNVDRLPPGEKLTSMYPWKLWQVQSDVYGNNAAPISFFQPNSNAQELMAIYDKFSIQADDDSGVPRYMTGGNAGGAGRTASGMSMMIGNAGKLIKAVVSNVDTYVLGPAIERLYYHNMKYGADADLKGDVRVVARGAASLIVKEQAQVRRNEFVNILLTNPAVAAIIGEEAIADLLRTMAQGLDMDADKLIPPPEVIRARIFAQKQEALQAQQMANRQAQIGAETPTAPPGAQQGPQVMPDNGQQLTDGAAVTDNFTPQRQ